MKIIVSHIWFSWLVVLDGWVNPILLLNLGPEAEVEMMRGFVYFLVELFSLQILVSVMYTCVCLFNKSLSSAYCVLGTIVECWRYSAHQDRHGLQSRRYIRQTNECIITVVHLL